MECWRPRSFQRSSYARSSRPHPLLPQGTCLACYGLWIGRKKQVRAEMLDEVFASLVAGGGEAGEDFPGAFAPLGFVAAGEFPGDHGCTWTGFTSLFHTQFVTQQVVDVLPKTLPTKAPETSQASGGWHGQTRLPGEDERRQVTGKLRLPMAPGAPGRDDPNLPPRGIEPLSENAQVVDNTRVTADGESVLASCLALLAQKDVDLGSVIRAWPKLPEAVKAGITAMVRATTEPPKKD